MKRTLRLSLSTILLATIACGTSVGNGDGDGGANDGDGGGNNEFVDAAKDESCKHVDLLISVDPSSSMTQELEAMRDEVFPAFANRLPTIGDEQGLEDFRVGTIDACPDPATLHTTSNAGSNCNFQGGHPWIESISTEMNAEFACVGDINTTYNCSGNNDDERPASAAAAALSPPYSTNQNAGFVRDDALLVIVAITDEDEQPVPDATAQEVYNRIVAIKGDVRKVVFLGIGGSTDCTGVYGDAYEAVKLKAITNSFIAQNRGVWWNLCDGNLASGLDSAFAVIEQACDELPQVD